MAALLSTIIKTSPLQQDEGVFVVPPAFTADCGIIGCGITAAPASLRQTHAPAEATSSPQHCRRIGYGRDFPVTDQFPFTNRELSG
ncbi:MAG: hypothetical protein MUP11_13765 [Anaerolineales bacterium]|nr:hypothetical protein [Anaerolineales bacterium]